MSPQMLIEYTQLLSVLRLTRLANSWSRTAEAVLLALSITPISSFVSAAAAAAFGSTNADQVHLSCCLCCVDTRHIAVL
jgi:hypothetical protein